MYEVTLQFCTKILKLYLLLHNINLYLYIKQNTVQLKRQTNYIHNNCNVRNNRTDFQTKRQLRTIKVTVKVNCILCFKNFYLLLQNNFLHIYSTSV